MVDGRPTLSVVMTLRLRVDTPNRRIKGMRHGTESGDLDLSVTYAAGRVIRSGELLSGREC